MLFDHALLSSSTHFDMHYKLPYQDASTGVVEGCLIYKVEDVPFPGSQLPEELQSPIDLTAQLLKELPVGPSYHNSAVFKQWKKEGLNVSGQLMAVADSVDAEEAVKRRQKNVSTREMVINPDAIDCAGDYLRIIINYEIKSGFINGTVISLSKETLVGIADMFAQEFFSDANWAGASLGTDPRLLHVVVENNGYFKASRLSLDVSRFVELLAGFYLHEGIDDFLYTYKYQTSFYRFPKPEMWIDDGKDCGNTGGGSGGGTGSGNIEESKEPDPVISREDSIKEMLFDKVFLNKVAFAGLEPEKWLTEIEIKVSFDQSTAYASYNNQTKELTIYWEKMQEDGLTLMDAYSSVFHECVHVKQDFIDGLSFERNEKGEIVTELYNIPCSDILYEREVKGLMDDFMALYNIPSDETMRTPEQQERYDLYYAQYVIPLQKLRDEKGLMPIRANKDKFKSEVEAYSLQLDYWNLSPKYKEETESNLRYFEYVYEQIKNK